MLIWHIEKINNNVLTSFVPFWQSHANDFKDLKGEKEKKIFYLFFVKIYVITKI